MCRKSSPASNVCAAECIGEFSTSYFSNGWQRSHSAARTSDFSIVQVTRPTSRLTIGQGEYDKWCIGRQQLAASGIDNSDEI